MTFTPTDATTTATPAGATPIVIDTDGGIDDAVALFWAATSPLVDLRAVTVVHGNTDVVSAAANVCRVLEAAGRPEIPVAIGAAEPMGPVPPLRRADFIHGRDGLGDTGRPPASFAPGDEGAVDLLARLLLAEPGRLALVTLGPLTNVAALVTARPRAVTATLRLVVMGGAVHVQGNAMPLAEANIAHDPTAAAIVATADWAQPPVLVGLDVTHQATLTAHDVALLARRATPAAAFLDEPLAFYARHAGTFCEPGEFPCHDLLATMTAVMDLVRGPVLPMAVQVEPGPAWGATVADRRQPFFARAGDGAVQATVPGFGAWEIGLEVDVAAFRRELRAMLGEPPAP